MIRVQEILRDCDTLKSNIIQNDTIDWSNRLKLQTLLEEAILTDINYSVDQQIEQLLWNICFKSCFDFLQNKLKFSRTSDENVKLPGDEDESAFLATFLKSSLSYFDRFMRKIEFSSKSDNRVFGYLDRSPPQIGKFDSKNVDYLINFCLIHLGDISRYRRRLSEAELFYLNAANLCPTNGHAFNQLAILETCRNRQLPALYFYYRSLYVESSFLLSASNLDKFFSTIDLGVQSVDDPMVIHFEESFYKFLACIHNNEDRKEVVDAHFRHAVVGFKNDVAAMSKYDFHHVAIILIANIWKINPSKEPSSLNRHRIEAVVDTTVIDFSRTEKMHLNYLLKFLQNFVRLLLRILREKLDDISSVLIIVLEWMREYADLLTLDEFCGEKSEFLYRFCDFLNCAPKEASCEMEPDQVLPEDDDLVTFLPLESQLSKIRTTGETFLRKAAAFHNAKPNYDNTRRLRLIKIGQFLVDLLNDEKLIKCSKVDSKFVFETSIKKEDIQEEDPYLEISESLTSSQLSDNSTPQSIPATETTTSKLRRQTKVLPLLGLTTKDSTKSENEVALTPKFKIAPAGSKVEMVLKGEFVKEIEDQSSNIKSDVIGDDNKSDNLEINKSPRENKYELPPRFQAAKLKHALSGALSNASKNRPVLTNRFNSNNVESMVGSQASPSPLLNLNSSIFPPLMNIPPPPLPPMFNRVPGAPRMMPAPNEAAFLPFRGPCRTFGHPMEFRPEALRNVLAFPSHPPPPPNVVNYVPNRQPSGYLESSKAAFSTSLFRNNDMWPLSSPKTAENEIPNNMAGGSTYNLFRHFNPELKNTFSYANSDDSSSSVPASLSQTPFSTADSNDRLTDATTHQQSCTFELFDGKNLFGGSATISRSGEETKEPTASFSLFADSK